MPARRQQEQHTLDQRATRIGERLLGELAKARTAAGWSERQLAKRADIGRTAVIRCEAGSGTVETLITAMNALRFQLAEIGGGDNLGAMLSSRREKRGLTIEAAAAKAGLSMAVVARLEQGRGKTRDLFRLLALIAPKVRRRAPERAYWGIGDKLDRDSRFTPAAFMDAIYAAFGAVDLDPCAHAMSPVVAARRIMLAEGGDGLNDEWSGRLAFVNPPYSKQLDWLRRAHQQWSAGHVRTVVCLVPVRTDNGFFHETLYREADLFLLKGRLCFASVRGDSQPTPFSLWVVALGATAYEKARFAELVRGRWFRAAEVPSADTAPVSFARQRQLRRLRSRYGARRQSRLDKRRAGSRRLSKRPHRR